jgi:glycosyltransferase involved in cell wall biosynthesis
MKVLIIGSRIPYPLHDGGAIATFNLLKGLSDAGAEVTFATINTKKHFADDITIKREFFFLKAIHTFLVDTGISAKKAFLNLFSSKSYNIERFYKKGFEDLLVNLVSTQHFDVIHFEGLFTAAYAPAIKQATKSPLLLRQHNIEFNIWKTLATQAFFPRKNYLNLLAGRMEKFEKHIIQVFDGIVTITETDRMEIGKWNYKGLLSSIPAGIDMNGYVPEIPEGNPALYHIGSMEWMPNQRAMDWFHAEIWPLIIKARPETRFYMAGKNMPIKYLELNTPGFHVAAEVESLQDFVRDKAILVVPLQSGSGIRIKTIEAMLAGKAVVSTSQGAHGLPVTDGENILIADSAEDFAYTVLRLLNDPGLQQQLAVNGREFASAQFSNEAVSEQWIQIYQGLIARG